MFMFNRISLIQYLVSYFDRCNLCTATGKSMSQSNCLCPCSSSVNNWHQLSRNRPAIEGLFIKAHRNKKTFLRFYAYVIVDLKHYSIISCFVSIVPVEKISLCRLRIVNINACQLHKPCLNLLHVVFKATKLLLVDAYSI